MYPRINDLTVALPDLEIAAAKEADKAVTRGETPGVLHTDHAMATNASLDFVTPSLHQGSDQFSRCRSISSQFRSFVDLAANGSESVGVNFSERTLSLNIHRSDSSNIFRECFQASSN
jgi:hypothetical protein